LEAGTTILGAFELVPFLEVGMREGLQDFTIHLYTDGLTEAMNPEEEEFGEGRFKEFIDKNKGHDPAQFHREFRSAMDKFSKKVPFHDDLTLLSLRFSRA
jgi:sigma-B regulation protein RsbU (phosphoserine phosphatase)